VDHTSVRSTLNYKYGSLPEVVRHPVVLPLGYHTTAPGAELHNVGRRLRRGAAPGPSRGRALPGRRDDARAPAWLGGATGANAQTAAKQQERCQPSPGGQGTCPRRAGRSPGWGRGTPTTSRRATTWCPRRRLGMIGRGVPAGCARGTTWSGCARSTGCPRAPRVGGDGRPVRSSAVRQDLHRQRRTATTAGARPCSSATCLQYRRR